MKMAIIFCCYNRKEMTERCLKQLHKQFEQYPNDIFNVYVFSDGADDGTIEMIRNQFPQVNLLVGEGNYYWCKSMHFGMKAAIKEKHDFYLMINDDVDFFENAIEIMLSSYYRRKKKCGVVGSTMAVLSNNCTYGGRDTEEQLILPGEERECAWANWNCFLIDSEIVEKVGIIDGKYQHAWGDYEYSFRMIKKGYSIYVADAYIGRCDLNSRKGSFRDAGISRKERLRKLFSPKGLPMYSYLRYHIRVEGVCSLLKYLYGYCSIIGYIILGKQIER